MTGPSDGGQAGVTEADRATAWLVMARLPISLPGYQREALDATAVVIAAALAAERARALEYAAKVLLAAAAEQRNEANHVPWDDEGTHADGHRCAADFLDRRAERVRRAAEEGQR